MKKFVMYLWRLFIIRKGKDISSHALTQEEISKFRNSEHHTWKSFKARLCYPIWSETGEEFRRSGDLTAMTNSFIVSVYIAYNWDKILWSKLYDINKINSQIEPETISLLNHFLGSLNALKDDMNHYESRFPGQFSQYPVFSFVSMFSYELLQQFLKKDPNFNPLVYFESGIILLFLFIRKLPDIDNELYSQLRTFRKKDEKGLQRLIHLMNTTYN